MNTREKNELLIKLMLVLVRDRKAMQGRIRSVGYTREYGELPSDLGVYTLGKLQDDEIIALADSIGLRKTRPVGAKSDIYMNDVGYAIYNFADDRPCILNGVTRDEMEALCRQAGVTIEQLDTCIQAYWDLRRDGMIGETVAIEAPASPFRGSREWLAPILRYIVFEGSETGASMFPAECVIDYSDPLNTETWSIYEPEEMMDLIWEKLTITMQERPVAEAEAQSAEPDMWSPTVSGTGRMALYIRVDASST